MDEREFIVAYSAYNCNISAVFEEEKNYMKTEYEMTLKRHNREYGDIVPWNNQLWASVKADNACEALNRFMNLLATKYSVFRGNSK